LHSGELLSQQAHLLSIPVAIPLDRHGRTLSCGRSYHPTDGEASGLNGSTQHHRT
jgi:hypothetical protein